MPSRKRLEKKVEVTTPLIYRNQAHKVYKAYHKAGTAAPNDRKYEIYKIKFDKQKLQSEANYRKK